MKITLPDTQGAAPQGDYSATVAEVSTKQGPSGDYLSVSFSVLGPLGREGESPSGDGQIVQDTFSLAPQAAWKARELITAIGGDPGRRNQETDEWIGKRLTVHLGPDAQNPSRSRTGPFAVAGEPCWRCKKAAGGDPAKPAAAPKAKAGIDLSKF